MEKSENKVPTPLENQLIKANEDKEMYRRLYNDCNKNYERLKEVLLKCLEALLTWTLSK